MVDCMGMADFMNFMKVLFADALYNLLFDFVFQWMKQRFDQAHMGDFQHVVAADGGKALSCQ